MDHRARQPHLAVAPPNAPGPRVAASGRRTSSTTLLSAQAVRFIGNGTRLTRYEGRIAPIPNAEIAPSRGSGTVVALVAPGVRKVNVPAILAASFRSASSRPAQAEIRSCPIRMTAHADVTIDVFRSRRGSSYSGPSALHPAWKPARRVSVLIPVPHDSASGSCTQPESGGRTTVSSATSSTAVRRRPATTGARGSSS